MDAHREAAERIPTTQESREVIDSLLAQVSKAQVLREIARDIRQSNAELRELLRENRLIARAKYEQMMELYGKLATRPSTATQKL